MTQCRYCRLQMGTFMACPGRTSAISPMPCEATAEPCTFLGCPPVLCGLPKGHSGQHRRKPRPVEPWTNKMALLDWAKSEKVRLIIADARSRWPGDAEGAEGEEGDIVHALCDALDALRAERNGD